MPEDEFTLQANHFEKRYKEMGWLWGTSIYSSVVEKTDFVGKKILDIGCGIGFFKDFLDKQGIKYQSYTGIDGSPSIVKDGLGRHKDGIDIRHIIWPYPSQVEKEELLDMKFDIAVILGTLYIFGPFDSGFPFQFISFTSSFIKESIIFDWQPYWQPSEVEKAELIETFILPGFTTLSVEYKDGRAWCIMKK